MCPGGVAAIGDGRRWMPGAGDRFERGSRKRQKLEVGGVEEKTSMGVEKAERDDKYDKG